MKYCSAVGLQLEMIIIKRGDIVDCTLPLVVMAKFRRRAVNVITLFTSPNKDAPFLRSLNFGHGSGGINECGIGVGGII